MTPKTKKMDLKFWLTIADMIQTGCMSDFDTGGVLSPETDEEVRAALKQAGQDYNDPRLTRLADISEADLNRIRDTVFWAVKQDLSFGLAEAIYYADSDSDSQLGYRIRSVATKALEGAYNEWVRKV
jgi:hypothetical protein